MGLGIRGRLAGAGMLALLSLTGCRDEAGTLPPTGEDLVAAQEITCIADGGRWGEGPTPGLKICYNDTEDGGEACEVDGDCEGFCLARSMTCAPVTPLFGCNEVLGVTGARSTVCVE